MPWFVYFAFSYVVLVLLHSWWTGFQQRRAISRWLEARGEIPLKLTKNKGFGIQTYDVDARKADGSEENYSLGIDYSFLTGRVREVMEMEVYYPFRDHAE